MSRYCDPKAVRLATQDPIGFEGEAPLYAAFHSDIMN